MSYKYVSKTNNTKPIKDALLHVLVFTVAIQKNERKILTNKIIRYSL